MRSNLERAEDLDTAPDLDRRSRAPGSLLMADIAWLLFIVASLVLTLAVERRA